MTDELSERLRALAETGERVGPGAGPAAVRSRARRRQQRRRVMGGGALAIVIAAGVAAAVAGGSAGGHPANEKVNVVAPPPTVSPTTVFASYPPTTLTTPTTAVILPLGPAVPASQLTALSFVDGTTGFALAGPAPRLAKTQNGGKTWFQVWGSAPAVSALRFASLTEGYAWGRAGLYATLDGGGTWHAVSVPHTVFDLQADHTGALALVGCPDGSCNESLWSISAGQVSTMTNPLPFRGQSGSLTGDISSTVYVTSSGFGSGPNAQLAWVDTHQGSKGVAILSDPCQSGDVEFQQIAIVSPFDLWLACAGAPATIQQGKQVYRSTNGGQKSWTLVASVGYGSPTGSITLSGHVNRLVAVDDNHASLALDRIGVLATSDGGRTWHPAFAVQPDSGPVQVTAPAGTTQVWAIAGQALWHTTDGVTWARL